MAALLRLGGIFLILGTILLGIGAYASVRRASIAAVNNGPAEGIAGWLGLAPWVGIALMILGVNGCFCCPFPVPKKHASTENLYKL